jgi:CorA-like Mg2+ transporter protein
LPTLKRGINEKVQGDEWMHEGWSDIENSGSDGENSDYGTADPNQDHNEDPHLGGDIASLTSTNLRMRSRPVAKKQIYVLDLLNKILSHGKAKEAKPYYTRFKLIQPAVPIIEDIGSRVTFDIIYEEAFSSTAGLSMLYERFHSSRSTKEHFMKLISVPSYQKKRELYPLGAIVPLVEIIVYDSLSLCKLISEVLDEIRQDMVDETKLEERLVLWRQFLRRCQRELSELQRCIYHFCNVIHSADPIAPGNFTEDSSHLPFTGTSDDFRTINDVLKRIGHLGQQAGTVSNMLTSNMSLLESKRSIAEAKSITKLTELAFLFIPLTFSATLFGMQVEEFNDRAPLSTFIAVALATTTISYGSRLLIRSRWVVSLRQVCSTRIQKYAKSKKKDIRRGQPTSFLIGWTIFEGQRAGYRALRYIYRIFKALLRRFWEAIDLVIIVSVGILIIVAPIAVLWTRNIDVGVKILITLILLLLMLAVVLIYAWGASTPAQRKAFSGMLRGEGMQFKSSSSLLRAVFWFMTITIIAVPLCVIWTRELAVSIKVAFTVVIVLFVVMGWVYFGIYKLFYAAREGGPSSASGSGSLAGD